MPALSFFLASRLLEKSGRDRVVRFVESLSIAFAAFLVFFEIRHWLQGGDPFAVTSDHLELGLMATAGLAFAIVMVRAQARRPDVVYDVASRLFGALTCVVCIAGLGGVANPLWSDEEVIGGAIFNSLMLAYLLPAILAAALAYFSWGVRPQWYVRTAGGVALALQLLYTLLEIRRIFQGPAIDASLETSQGELWTFDRPPRHRRRDPRGRVPPRQPAAAPALGRLHHRRDPEGVPDRPREPARRHPRPVLHRPRPRPRRHRPHLSEAARPPRRADPGAARCVTLRLATAAPGL